MLINYLVDKKMRSIRRLKKAIEVVAYLSLIVDIAIAASTLFYLNTSNVNFFKLQQLLNYALTAIVILSIILFMALVFLSYYIKLLARLAGITHPTENSR